MGLAEGLLDNFGSCITSTYFNNTCQLAVGCFMPDCQLVEHHGFISIDLLKGLTRHCRTPEKLMSEVESLQSRNGAGLQGWPFVGY